MMGTTIRTKDGKEIQLDIDPEHGLLYVHLAKEELQAGAKVDITETLCPGIRIDRTKDGHAIGIEVDVLAWFCD